MNKCKMFLWSVAEIRLIGISNLIFAVKIRTIQVDRWSFEVWTDHSTFVSKTYKVIVSTLIVTMFPARERLCFSRSANYLLSPLSFYMWKVLSSRDTGSHRDEVTGHLRDCLSRYRGTSERISNCHYTTGTETTNVWSPSATVFPSAARRQHGTIIAGRDNFVAWTRMSCRNRDCQWQLYHSTLYTSSCIQCKLIASCCWTSPRLANLRLIVYVIIKYSRGIF